MKPLARYLGIACVLWIALCLPACGREKGTMDRGDFEKALKRMENPGSLQAPVNESGWGDGIRQEAVEFHVFLDKLWSRAEDGVPAGLDVPSINGDYSALAIREKAREELRAVNSTEAVRDFEKVAGVYGDSPTFLLELGEAELVLLDTTGAVVTLEGSVSKANGPVHAYVLIEAAESIMNHYPEALDATRKALALAPDVPYLRYREGRQCAVLHDFECSIRAYGKIIDVHPKALYQLAEAYFQLGQYEEAAKNYENLVKTYPGHSLVMSRLAETYMNMGQYGKAEKTLREELARRPDDHTARMWLATNFLLAGQPERALEELNLVIETKPDLPRAHELRAKCYLALGEPEKAAIEYREFLDKN